MCGSCIEVCPTGALTYAGYPGDSLSDKEMIPVKCSNACPAGVDVPRMTRALIAGRPMDALAVLQERVPLAHTSGYICSHPCENECRRNGLNGAVAIRMLEKYAGNNAESKISVCEKSTGKRVAVIGSGAAGLTAAYYLAVKGGHQVTVLESGDKIGGRLRKASGFYSPALDADIAVISRIGVIIRTGVNDISIEKLLKEGFSAVVVADNVSTMPAFTAGVFTAEGFDNDFIHATAAGRIAAGAANSYLGGNASLEEVLATTELDFPKVGKRPDFASMSRCEEPCDGIISQEAAINEAKRCMNCDLRMRAKKMTDQPSVPVKQRAPAND